MSTQPNNTVYVNNLNERVNIAELKKALTHVFAQFGKILEVQASKALKKKGQAWVVFDEVKSAEKCVKEMEGFNFYDKPMRVTFAKRKSDVIAKRDGTFVPRPEKPNKYKRKGKKRKLEGKEGKKANGKTKNTAPPVPTNAPPSIPLSNNPAAMVPGMSTMSFPPRREAAPNRILFVENLPPDCKSEQLDAIFGKFPGFKETRVVGGKNVAFVDFENDYLAGLAMEQCKEAKIGAMPIHISFAK
mmetsp:Transcript_18249/g.34866  ORF Transcript_18249/g.34866 Transcript_18249/m.34866 type:complete len:244 (-) Transcript_18249:117-848(-)